MQPWLPFQGELAPRGYDLAVSVDPGSPFKGSWPSRKAEVNTMQPWLPFQGELAPRGYDLAVSVDPGSPFKGSWLAKPD